MYSMTLEEQKDLFLLFVSKTFKIQANFYSLFGLYCKSWYVTKFISFMNEYILKFLLKSCLCWVLSIHPSRSTLCHAPCWGGWSLWAILSRLPCLWLLLGLAKGSHQQGIMGRRQEERGFRVVTPLTIPTLLDCGAIAFSLQDHISCQVAPFCQVQIWLSTRNGSLSSFRPSFPLLLFLGCSPSAVASLMLTHTFIIKPLVYSFNHPFAISRAQVRWRCLDYQIPVAVISSILSLIQPSRFRSPTFSLPNCIQKVSSHILSVTKLCLTCHFYPFVSFFNHNSLGLSLYSHSLDHLSNSNCISNVTFKNMFFSISFSHSYTDSCQKNPQKQKKPHNIWEG